MNKNIYFILIFLCGIMITSCNIDPIDNPNGPTLESLENGATAADLQLLVSGVESSMRIDMGFYYQTVSIVGREYYDLNGTDPRYTGELLGAGDGAGVLDNNGFLTTRAFGGRYRSIRNAQTLINAVNNTSATLTSGETDGYIGYAKGVQAYQLLLTLNRQYENGIRSSFEDPDNLGSFTDYSGGLSQITALLDEAIGLVANSGDAFAFTLSSGFAGYDTPATFNQFLNAIKARVALYAGNKSAALDALGDSFLNTDTTLNIGPAHVFGLSGNDQANPIFYVPETDLYMAHPSFITDTEPGDSRLSKVTTLADTITLDELVGYEQVQLYATNTSPVSIIRNEELILIYAEAMIGTDNDEAITAINIIRNAAGIGAYGGNNTDSDLEDEILYQRRYSLFGEGHRWIDMRRYNRLGDLPTDRAGDEVFTQFPRPVQEG